MTPSKLDDIAIENFQNYLRIPSVHPNINYSKCPNIFNIYHYVRIDYY